jgi:hypothetical protein
LKFKKVLDILAEMLYNNKAVIEQYVCLDWAVCLLRLGGMFAWIAV